jgi:hypothetical protein
MTGVIMHTCEMLNENRNPRQGPQIRTEAVGPRPLPQFPVQTLNLLSIDSRPASSSTSTTESTHATSFPLPIPSADTLAGHSQSSRDLGHDQLSGRKHTGRLVSPLFQRSKIPSRTKSGRHAHIINVAGTIVTLLCEIQ